MNTRNRFRDVLFASITAATFLGLQPVIAVAQPKADQQQAQERAEAQERAKAQARDTGHCKKYVREHRGHPDPAKGVDIVKVVYVPCSKKG
ncbi:hypothetical protein HNQ60_003841 [Povalibacter uvarum]|uniref:Uncharacterized protein n=1 Tax=Povalibacter uvarum TaxID=732238 RepID=A0A841HQN9_9GAMM|nr:hypothetical protein [Povalibacter uvarum]MBB6094954.1 hypothetical protein [Povalibacter uvarum]